MPVMALAQRGGERQAHPAARHDSGRRACQAAVMVIAPRIVPTYRLSDDAIGAGGQRAGTSG